MSELRGHIERCVVGYGHSPHAPSASTVQLAENLLGLKFGEQLRDYLLTYGSLWKDGAELYGINECQKCDSDLVSTTLNVIEYYAKAIGMVVVDNRGDGQYVFCDMQDQMFEMPIDGVGNPIPLHMDLMTYICKRLNNE